MLICKRKKRLVAEYALKSDFVVVFHSISNSQICLLAFCKGAKGSDPIGVWAKVGKRV